MLVPKDIISKKGFKLSVKIKDMNLTGTYDESILSLKFDSKVEKITISKSLVNILPLNLVFKTEKVTSLLIELR